MTPKKISDFETLLPSSGPGQADRPRRTPHVPDVPHDGENEPLAAVPRTPRSIEELEGEHEHGEPLTPARGGRRYESRHEPRRDMTFAQFEAEEEQREASERGRPEHAAAEAEPAPAGGQGPERGVREHAAARGVPPPKGFDFTNSPEDQKARGAIVRKSWLAGFSSAGAVGAFGYFFLHPVTAIIGVGAAGLIMGISTYRGLKERYLAGVRDRAVKPSPTTGSESAPSTSPSPASVEPSREVSALEELDMSLSEAVRRGVVKPGVRYKATDFPFNLLGSTYSLSPAEVERLKVDPDYKEKIIRQGHP